MIELQIDLIARDWVGFERFISNSGIGQLSAVIFLAKIGDVNDIANANKLSAYLEIISSSNIQMRRRGKIGSPNTGKICTHGVNLIHLESKR